MASAIVVVGGPTRSDAFSDGAGTEWLPLSSTADLSAGAIATVCPRDGVTPCNGTVSGKNLTGWVWATEAQLRTVLAARVSSLFVSGNVANGFGYGIAFVDNFGATGYFANTYSASEWSYGWTSSVDDAGLPIGAGGSWGFPPFAGGAGLGAAPDSAEDRGAFLWRADGSGGTAAVANDDSGTVDPPFASVAVANVLANDTLAGSPASVTNVTLATVSASPGLSLDSNDGSVDVAAGTRPGSHSLVYRMCSRVSLTNCDNATVSVLVTGNIIDAVDDAGATTTAGGTAVPNVLANDRLQGAVATTATVTLRLDSASPGVSLDVSDGSVDVAAGPASGARTLAYTICEIAAPYNCDAATVAVTVNKLPIVARYDSGSASAITGGEAISDVRRNDRLDGQPATSANVALSVVFGAEGLTLDLTDGSVDVAAGTSPGTRSIWYQICELAVPDNCAAVNASVEISPQAIVVSDYRPTVREGTTGTVTVRLAQRPLANVVVAAKFLAGTTAIAPGPLKLTFTPANWNVAQTLRLPAKQDTNQLDAAATITLSSPDIATAHIVATVRDDDHPITDPAASMVTPLNGDTVSGIIPISAAATVSSGGLDKIEYYSKGVRLYRGPSGGTVSYDTRVLLNGWRVLEIRATDTAENESRLQFKVLVAN